MDWNDAEDVAMALYEQYPEIDPLSLRFTDLHRMVMELKEFEGDVADSNEGKLESIQMAWLEERQLNEG